MAPLQEHYNYYIFYKNGLFDYHSGASLGDDKYGKGHYYIKNDSLTLNYDLTKLKESSYHKHKLYRNSKDSIQVKIKVFNFNKKSLSNIEVSNLKSRYGIITNKNGFALLKFKKQKGRRRIDVSGLCCGNYSFYINEGFNYEIEVFLNESFNNPLGIKNDIVKYKIIKLSKEEIKLKRKNSIIVLKKKK